MPAAVVTVTSTVPAAAARGLMTTILVFVSLTMVAAVVPKSTAVAFASARPVIVTVVPPAVGPARWSDGTHCRAGRGASRKERDRRGLVAAVVVRRFAPGGVGKVTGSWR